MGFDFTGKTVGITGASSVEGIGFAVAEKFIKAGARVAIFGLNEDAMKNVTEILSAYGTIKSYRMDVSREEAVKQVFMRFIEDFKGVDIWINNAGIYPQSGLMEMETQLFEKTLDINLKSVFWCTREAFAHMKKKGGVIINAASYAALLSSAGSGAYAASKAAVYSLTKTLAAELAPYNIRVNGFIPGVIETGMTRPVIDERRTELERAIAMKRLGKPEDVANAVAFLASEEASYLTGTFLEISGGKLCVQNPEYGWKKKEKEETVWKSDMN